MSDLTTDQRELLYSIAAGLPMAAPSELWDDLLELGLIERELNVQGMHYRATGHGHAVLGVRPV